MAGYMISGIMNTRIRGKSENKRNPAVDSRSQYVCQVLKTKNQDGDCQTDHPDFRLESLVEMKGFEPSTPALRGQG